ncbi:MAG: hypothetical protein IPK33_03040 [Gemmatimonadetes bacterium]|nr:hypothetical protein [Gemmatimonadota bacterium]
MNPELRRALRLATELQSARPERAEDIARALRELRHDAWPALPVLVSQIRRSPSEPTWRRVLSVLSVIGDSSDVVVPAVAEFLHGATSTEARLAALECLRSYPGQLAPVIDVLLDLGEGLEDEDVAAHALVVAALDGEALLAHAGRVARLAAARPAGFRSAAVACLASMMRAHPSPSAHDFQILADVAASPDTVEALEALHAIASLAPGSAIVAAQLIPIAAQGEVIVALRALDALYALGTSAAHVADDLSRLDLAGLSRAHQMRAVAAMDRDVLSRRLRELTAWSCAELEGALVHAELGSSILPLLEVMLETQSGAASGPELALIELRELARLGNVDALAKWVPRSRPDPYALDLVHALRWTVETEGTVDSVLALASFDPRLRGAVAARLSLSEELPESALPFLVAWIGDPDASEHAIEALVRASGQRSWLRSLLWNRLATIPVGSFDDVRDQLTSALAAEARMREEERSPAPPAGSARHRWGAGDLA